MRIERHSIGVWVREDGCIYLPTSGKKPAHWTFGWKNSSGYRLVTVNKIKYRVHRLVAEVFIPNPENKPEVDHIDKCPCHNSIDNLRWATHSENQRNTRANDRVEARGETHRYLNVNAYLREWQHRKKCTHKRVLFSDGTRHWVINYEADKFLSLPVKERHYGNG